MSGNQIIVVVFVLLMVGLFLFLYSVAPEDDEITKQRKVEDESANLVISQLNVFIHDAEKFRAHIDRKISEHFGTLIRKRKQLVTKDAYDNEILDGWHKELRYFADSTIAKGEYSTQLQELRTMFQLLEAELSLACTHETALTKGLQRQEIDPIELRKKLYASSRNLYGIAESEDVWEHFVTFIDIDVEFSAQNTDNPLLNNAGVDVMSGNEYEMYCSDILENLGWSITHTKQTGDQGIDLIGVLNDTRVVFQCKCYSTPVGNAAVQEVLAGQQFEGADLAVVVSNNTYTRSAQQLAQTTNVLLLHHSQLEQLTATLLDE